MGVRQSHRCSKLPIWTPAPWPSLGTSLATDRSLESASEGRSMAVRRAHMRPPEGRRGGSLAAHFLGRAAVALTLFTAVADPAGAGGTLTVGMTAGDIPVTTGNPDQGFEGYRFVGYNLY